MPIMDGFEATEKILECFRDNPHLRGNNKCNIVALTSYTDDITINRCMSLGMKEVLNKPLNFDDLKRIIFMYHYDITHK